MRRSLPASNAFLKALADSREKYREPRVKSRAVQLGAPGTPKPKRALSRETPRVTAIIKALRLKGYWAFRNNSSLTVIPEQGKSRRRVIKGGEAGSPDIFVVIRRPALPLLDGDPLYLGVLGGIEVKTEVGRQSASQKLWQAKAERHGVRYGLATSIEQAFALVEKWSGE